MAKLNKKWGHYGDSKQDIDNLKLYLLKHGIPPRFVDEVRAALVNDAIRESTDMKYDRIYAGIALAAYNSYGFGAKRALRLLRAFDDLAGSMAEPGNSWDDLMLDLRNKTGLVVRTDEENRLVFEYIGKDVEEAKEA